MATMTSSTSKQKNFLSTALLSNILCKYCEKKGHLVKDCEKPKKKRVSLFTVHLPFKSEARPSNNFQTAKQRLFALERKLNDHDDVKQQYHEFIKEFVDMGHLEETSQNPGLCYYLLHLCVFKDSMTRKFRVVFEASSKSRNDSFLNDCLLLEPPLQDDVFDILFRFCLHQHGLSAYVAKMYRQVALDESDGDFHRILWCDYMTDETRELRMTRVTHGVASSSYYSTRALQKSLGSTGLIQIQ